MEKRKSKRAGPDGTGAGGRTGIRVPAPGESSSSDIVPGIDGATLPGTSSTPPVDSSAAPADATLIGGPATPGGTRRRPSQLFPKQVALQPGDVLGGRFEILEILGEGGMGTVYKATDREVDHIVALKLIRPEMAEHPEILARFKQELLTARQVTHKNVIRIHDLSEVDGVKFITMEFVEGCDLRRLLLDNGKLPPEQAVEIVRQVCLALDAAHSAGVIHRDLKPQNIMKDQQGRILVMDFGLARSLKSDGMTQTGALLGTIEYMSPEQAMGRNLDGRSDLFTVGLIFYELLTCRMPFKADTAMASLLKRNQERALPAAELDPSIPKGLSDIVGKCLERDVSLRYQSAQEILADLDAWQGKRPTSASMVIPALAAKRELPWKWIGAGGLAVALAIGGWAVSGKLTSNTANKPAAGPEVSLAIVPFRNGSGDAGLDWLGPSLADMLNTDVGHSAHLRTISPDRLHQVLSDLRITPGTTIDSTMVGRIAEFSNADTVVWGQYVKFGDQIRIDATLLDLKHNRREPLKIEAASEKEIPRTVDGLAELIRRNLAVSSDVLKELKATSFQPTSQSAPALRAYNAGVQLLREGKNLEALHSFQAAVKNDPQFALAYSRLAETDSALGYDPDAEQSSRKALELGQQLPAIQKYLIEANHARIVRDNNKAIQIYEKLAQSMPDDLDIQYALGNLYLDQSEYDKARAHYANVLKFDPKNLNALQYTGWLEVTSGKPEAGLDPLNRALTISVQVDNQEQKGEILQVLGMAYESLNKFDEAMRNFQQALEIDRKLGKKFAIANSLVEMGNVQSSLGKPEDARRNYTEALQLQREIGAKARVAATLIALGQLFEDGGQYDKALQLYKESLQAQRDLGDQSGQAVCLNNIGNVYLAQSKNDDALTYYQQALQLREKLNAPGDTADTLHNLGEAHAKTAQYESAMASYMRALDLRRKTGDAHGAAIESHSIGMVFLYQGRYGAAVNALDESVKGFRELKDRSRIMTQVLIDFADSLAKVGRGAEVGKTLEEAHGLATELKNDKLMSDVLNSQGDVLFYRGDWKAAKGLYQQGFQVASRAKAQEAILVSRLNLAKVAIAEGQSQAAISSLRQLVEQANTQGLKYLSIDSSICLAEALISSKNYSAARQELEQQLGTSEKLGLRMHTATIHYLLATSLRGNGDTGEASTQYREAVRLLDDIKREPGAEKLLDRADLKFIYDESNRWSQEKPS
jgi:eukaryotic-like serine/threonine-protein kinase